MPPAPRTPSIAVIGAGPRGTSLIERLGANLDELLPDDAPLELHVIDEAQSGAGRIWRTDQDRELCMNTLAHAVTLFTEPGSTVVGPVRPGPTLYEWCVLVRDGGRASEGSRASGEGSLPAAHVATFAAHPVRAGLAADYRDELVTMRPESHPSRALYGEYLAWCYSRALAELPRRVRVVRHRSRAVGVEASDTHRRAGTASDPEAGSSPDTVLLADGGRIAADAVSIAAGWMPRASTPAEQDFEARLAERPELVWVRPESPAEQPFERVAPGAHAIVRGLGMGFFDAMALLTIGRGGRFVDDSEAPGGLRYEPSGREPVLHITSRRGVPFRAKTLYGSLPPSPAQRFARSADWASAPRPIDFDRQLWPRIVADAYLDHAETLLRVRPSAVTATSAELRTEIEAALTRELAGQGADRDPSPARGSAPDVSREFAALIGTAERIGAAAARCIPDPADRLDLPAEMRPVHERFDSPAAFDAWVARRVADDLREADLGHDSAIKAGLWSISAARALAGDVGTLGGFDAESRDSGYRMLLDLGGMVGSGPPAFRNRQLLALAGQGLVHFIGPEARVELGPEGFTAGSEAVIGSEVTAPVLIDAWMHAHRLAETADPLAQSLLESGRARAFEVTTRQGSPVATGAFDLEVETGRLLRADGSPDSSVHIAGIPVDEAVHGTIISPMPGTDPPMLRETDRVARSALRTVRSPR